MLWRIVASRLVLMLTVRQNQNAVLWMNSRSNEHRVVATCCLFLLLFLFPFIARWWEAAAVLLELCTCWLLSCQADADLQGSEAQRWELPSHHGCFLSGRYGWVFVLAANYWGVKASCIIELSYLSISSPLRLTSVIVCVWWSHEIYLTSKMDKNMLK